MVVKKCSPGNKKFAKIVNGKCIRFGDPNMTIKKHLPGRKKSFCARHKCSEKRDKATPGYQSCLKWNCKMSGRSSSVKNKRKSKNKKRSSGKRKKQKRSNRRR